MKDKSARIADVPSVRIVAMPADTNPNGDIFGGWLMSQMDLAAGNVASRHVGGRVVTVAVEAMSFLHPVSVGDEVSVYAKVEAVGRTSLRLAVQTWIRPYLNKEEILSAEGSFTFVSIGDGGRPQEITSRQ